MIRPVSTLARMGAVAAIGVLSACTDSRPADEAARPVTSRAPQEAVATTATTTAPPRPVVERIGQPFTLDGLRLTMLSVQDPFPPSPAVQPRPGHRLVSIKYETVSQTSASRSLSDLPSVELRDSSGAGYRSEHGRISMTSGVRTPGELPGGNGMQTSAMFEVPASATSLSVAFRPLSGPDQGVMVTLD